LVGHPAEEEGVRLREILGMVIVQLFVRKDGTMIAAPV
jgi:hypothetical protein